MSELSKRGCFHIVVENERNFSLNKKYFRQDQG